MDRLKEIYNIINKNIDNTKKNDIKDENSFKLPIYYQDDKMLLQENIKYDLEMVDNKIYKYLFTNDNIHAVKLIKMWSMYYSFNTKYLKETKSFLKTYKSLEIDFDMDDTLNIVNDIRNETGFFEKYKYLDLENFEFLNKNPIFLQSLSIYNLASPVISLIIPIVFLIIPFFLIKIQHKSITFNEYANTLLYILKNQYMGKALIEFSSASWDRKFFTIFTVIIYFFNIYQNFLSCTKFYHNFNKIKSYLQNIKQFLNYSIKLITNINNYCKDSYIGFINKNNEIKDIISEHYYKLDKIELEKTNITQLSHVGNILANFYNLYSCSIYNNAIDYCFSLYGYNLNIIDIQNNIKNNNVNYANFNKKVTNLYDSYFAPLVNSNPIKNNIFIDNNIIITGPNASGKTTILKSALFNIILSQQLSIGFYSKAEISPFKFIHSYLNIPDTSNRDSLFQAEARRCKEILDIIISSKNNDKHFCIFDELYSGTNPNEAIASAISYLEFISKYTNARFMLTTHYLTVCENMKSYKNIINKHMKLENDNSTFILENGISYEKSGIKILKQLNYPNEIIESANLISNNYKI